MHANMKELMTVVMSEEEGNKFGVTFQLDDQTQLTQRLDKLLEGLVRARMRMQPPAPLALPQGECHEVVLASDWSVAPAEGKSLAIRLHHPALGWLSWALPPRVAKEMGVCLLRVLAQTLEKPKDPQ